MATKAQSGSVLSTNKHLLRWVEKMADLTRPDSIHWVDGSQQEYDRLCALLVDRGTFVRLNRDLWPGCFYARSDVRDVARVEERTFICSLSRDSTGPTNNWEDPFQMRRKLKDLFQGSMRGRTMYVLAFCMGPLNSPASQIGVQLTDSPYVVVNMRIMARIGRPVFAEIDKDVKRARMTCRGPATTPSTSSTFLNRAKSGPMAPATAATRCSAKNALLCASLPTWLATRAGWPSTCSSSASKTPLAKKPTWPLRFLQPVAKPTSP
jgi:GTP-dependent phosphoenolpyruvate carboxykinase